jgi:hypothetical protein
MERVGSAGWGVIASFLGWTTPAMARLMCVSSWYARFVRSTATALLFLVTGDELAVDNRLWLQGCAATRRCFWVTVRRQARAAAARWWLLSPEARETRRVDGTARCMLAGHRDHTIRANISESDTMIARGLSESRAELMAELSELMAGGLDLNAPKLDGHTLLWHMCYHEYANVVYALLLLGASPTNQMKSDFDFRDNYVTARRPLIKACKIRLRQAGARERDLTAFLKTNPHILCKKKRSRLGDNTGQKQKRKKPSFRDYEQHFADIGCHFLPGHVWDPIEL